tara:strand:- start:4270 stop:5133 length:864 start_codon:yes stop_codon:yes gene_type:complete
MKSLFYILSFIPKPLFSYFVDIYLFLKIFKLSTSYKITKINLEIAFPEVKKKEIELMAKLCIRESIISGFETIYTWGRSDFDSNSYIFKIENNFLLNSLSNQNQGLIAVTFHNRSVDMLLKWINSQVKTTSLYKKIKIKLLSNFVKRDREATGSKTFETSIGGVREMLRALYDNKTVVFAADQVPRRGLGEHIKFFNKHAYTTTLVQSLAIKTRAPVIYFYIRSNPGNFLSVNLKRCNDSIYNDSKHKLLLNQDIENMIKERPVDYSWEYKRFRRNKDGRDNPYIGI